MNWGTLSSHGFSRRGVWLEEPSMAGFVFQTNQGETFQLERKNIRSMTMFKRGDYRIVLRDGSECDLIRDEAL